MVLSYLPTTASFKLFLSVAPIQSVTQVSARAPAQPFRGLAQCLRCFRPQRLRQVNFKLISLSQAAS
jgi:hypothetical protein